MAKTVFILGAGASKATGAPLMKGFVDVALALRETHSRTITLPAFEQAFDLIQGRLQLLHAKSAVDLENIEELFGIVEMARVVGRLPSTQPEELESMAVSVRRVLAETIEESTRFQLTRSRGGLLPSEAYGTLGSYVRQELKGGRAPDVAFITFNYDVALDFALHWNSVTPDYGIDVPAPRTVPLLKLHGSLNWGACPKCHALRALPLDMYFRHWSPPDRGGTHDSLRPSRMLHVLGEHCPGGGAPTEPAIVPPSWNKTQYRVGFARVWERAAEEIAKAESIIIAGYSLPPSDMFFRDLLAVALAGPTRIRRLQVVNPDGAVAAECENCLGRQ